MKQWKKINQKMTLYAGWEKDVDDSAYSTRTNLESADLNCTISPVKAKVYDGNAYEPDVRVSVTVDGKKKTLAEGLDYRRLYKDNISAGTGTVIIRGNGLYTGEKTLNFTIAKKPVKKLKIITGSIAGNAADMKLSQLPVYVYSGARLINYGAGYTLSNLQVVKGGVRVTVTGTDNYTGETAVNVSEQQKRRNSLCYRNWKGRL